MKRRLSLILTATLVLVGLPAGIAAAATHSPCIGHQAVAPYVDVITVDPVTGEDVTILGGAGQIGGCPFPIGTESVAINVCLQAMIDGVWVDQICQLAAKSWNFRYRFARQAGTSVFAPCLVTDWRTDVRGALSDGTADGFAIEWASPAVTMVRNDSGLCGKNTGGGP